MHVNTMTRDMINDAIVAGARIWGCTVVRQQAVAGHNKGLEKWTDGGGGEE